MILPTIHLNGTSREELQRQAEAAVRALDDAIARMSDAAPNGRDYYPQGPDVIRTVAREHSERIGQLKRMRDDMMKLWELTQ